MRRNGHSTTKVNTNNQRSYFAWSNNMQVIRKGNGDIVMTESELIRFFGVTWKKLNHRLQLLMKSCNLHPNEREAGEEGIFLNGCLQGYAPLYPLSIIIALSFQLDSLEAHLFRKYVCTTMQRPISVITPILLIGNKYN